MTLSKRVKRLEGRLAKGKGYKPPDTAEEALAEVERYHAAMCRLIGKRPFTEEQKRRFLVSWRKGGGKRVLRFYGE